MRFEELKDILAESQIQSDKAGFLHNITENFLRIAAPLKKPEEAPKKEKHEKKEPKVGVSKLKKTKSAVKKQAVAEEKQKDPEPEPETQTQEQESMTRFIATLADQMSQKNLVRIL